MATKKGMMRNIFVRLCQISKIPNSKVQYAYGFVWKHVCAHPCDILKRESSPMKWSQSHAQWSRLSNAYDRQYNSSINSKHAHESDDKNNNAKDWRLLLWWFGAFSYMNVVISIWSKWVTVQCANLRVEFKSFRMDRVLFCVCEYYLYSSKAVKSFIEILDEV